MAELRPNRAKEKLANGEIVTCLAGVDTPHLVDFVGQIGIDAVWLEAEHGPVDFEAIGDLSRAADLWGVTPLVRVGSVDYNTIYRTLDMGAMGITVPHVDTAQDARDVVQAAKYAPIGNRGMYGPRQAFGVTDFVKKANDQTMVVVLIEDILAVNNLDEILEVDHIDVYHVAPSDLAQSMGASKWAMLRHIRLPAAMPAFASGLRVAAAVAPIGAVVGEWVGSSAGLGYMMLQANARMQVDVMFAALFLLAGIAVGLYAAVDAGLKRALPWQAEDGGGENS